MGKQESHLQTYTGITPSLYVGLGKLGCTVVREIETVLQSRFSPLQDHPVFQFLRFDSAFLNKEDSFSYLDFTRDAASLFNSASESKNSWLPPEIRKPSDFTCEGLLRSHLIISACSNIHTLKEACSSAVNAVSNQAAREKAMESHLSIDDGVNVYVISSLWERTSTALLWLTAKILRDTLSDMKGQSRIIGIFLFPPLDPEIQNEGCGSEEINGMTYAVLKEMEHLNSNLTLTLALPEHEKLSITGNPFDFSYIVNCRELLPDRLDTKTMESLLKFFSLDSDLFFSPRLKSARDQLIIHMDCPMLAFGVGEILFPYEYVIDWCSRKLCFNALHQWGKKESACPVDDLLKRLYRIMDVKNPDKADEEFFKRMGKPRETAWHVGRTLRDLPEQYKKEELIEKLEEEYRRIGAEEISESSHVLELKMKDSLSTQHKKISKTLLEMAGDCAVGLPRLKNLVSSLLSFLHRCHQSTDKKIAESALRLDELERDRMHHIKALRKLVKSPLFFFQKGKLASLFEETIRVSERVFEERLILHILTSALEYYHTLRELTSQFKEPVEALFEVYESLSAELKSEGAFEPERKDLSLFFADEAAAEKLYRHYTGSIERTLGDIISAFLSLIPLELNDLTNRRVIRDLKHNGIEVMYSRARQCFDSIKEKPVTELFHELLSDEEKERLLRELIEISAPAAITGNGDWNQDKKLHLIGFYEGNYPQTEASEALVCSLSGKGFNAADIADIEREDKIVSFCQSAGLKPEAVSEQAALECAGILKPSEGYLHLSALQEKSRREKPARVTAV